MFELVEVTIVESIVLVVLFPLLGYMSGIKISRLLYGVFFTAQK